MLKQIVNFQKLLLINTFTFNGIKPDLDKSKGSGYKANVALYLLFVLSLLMFDLSLFPASTYLLSAMMINLFILNMSFIKGSWAFFKTLPVDKGFVISNVILSYPLSVLAFVVVFFAFLAPSLIGSIVANRIRTPPLIIVASLAKPFILACVAGLCICSMWPPFT